MVSCLIETYIEYPLGSRIKIGDNYGTVKFVGEVNGHVGTWLGVEWDEPQRGKHNGSVDGKHYFYTQHPTAGSFIRPNKISAFETLEDAVRERYLDYSSNSIDQTMIHDMQRNMQASIFEVVGMEKIARKQSKFEQLQEVCVDNSAINSAGYLKDLSVLTSLDLTHSLIWNWKIVADIVSQVPSLLYLNLSCNRLLVPTAAEVVELEPAFRQLQAINLRNCGFKNWADVVQTALLWPNILSLGLQENELSELSEVNTKQLFRKLKELDLHRTKVMDFDQILKLGNINTLTSLNLMENGLEEIKLPDCAPNEKLQIFASLEQLNLSHNSIWSEADTFNELDKLPKLKRLTITPNLKSDFFEMFSKAVAYIPTLEVVNKIRVSEEDRRGGEYDVWKKYALEWLKASQNKDSLRDFYKKHRSYANVIKKYGSPAEFIPRSNAATSRLIKVRVQYARTGEVWEKKVPRMITVQTLQGLIMKHFGWSSEKKAPHLAYVDAKYPELIVPLENGTKTLDFYSVQDQDTVIVQDV